MNRVNQIYNDDLAVRMVLIDDTDKLNLDTAAKATEPNGPCGSAPCFTARPAHQLRRRLAQPQPHRARPARRRLAATTSATSRSASTAAASPASA